MRKRGQKERKWFFNGDCCTNCETPHFLDALFFLQQPPHQPRPIWHCYWYLRTCLMLAPHTQTKWFALWLHRAQTPPTLLDETTHHCTPHPTVSCITTTKHINMTITSYNKIKSFHTTSQLNTLMICQQPSFPLCPISTTFPTTCPQLTPHNQ